MGFGKKKSSPAPSTDPVVTDVNDSVPDANQKRGVPISDDGPSASKSLLDPGAGADPKKRPGTGSMLY